MKTIFSVLFLMYH